MPGFWRGLSARLVVLTITFVMIAEVLIYVPSISRFRLDYLEQNNVHFLNLDLIAWRMRNDVDFFRKTIQLLRDRHAYSDTLWSYAILHNDAAVAREDFESAARLRDEIKATRSGGEPAAPARAAK